MNRLVVTEGGQSMTEAEHQQWLAWLAGLDGESSWSRRWREDFARTGAAS